MTRSVDVCVVGAGPGGALLSLLLVKKGISVLLVERTSQLAKSFRGEHLNETGEAILKESGLLEQVEKLGLLRMETLEYWHQGAKLKQIEADPEVGHLGIHVPQAHLLQVIIDEAKKYPPFQYLLNTTVKDLIQNVQGHYTGLKAMHDGEEIIIHTKLIIGADGRFSTIRQKIGIDVTKHDHGYDILWARIPAPQGWSPAIKMTLVDGMQISIFTQALGFIQIGWNIPKGSYNDLRQQPFEQFIEQLVNAFPQLKTTVESYITSWKDFVLLDVYSSSSEQWGKNGVALIGDAVHAMTPTGAFGLNCALEDAALLAGWLTKETLENFDFVSCANKRKVEIEKIQAIQIEKERSFADQFIVMD